MTPERFRQIEELYLEVLELPADQRALRLAAVEPELRAEVESLLAIEDTSVFLDQPLTPSLGPYRIGAKIGAGGMGTVYEATDTRLDRKVAIKLCHVRIEDEARAIAALNHPNICTLHDVGPNFLVMEYLEGQTLAERIRKGPLPPDEALAIARQIGLALEAAHEARIVHRDLKPENVMLTPIGAKVLDFGLARRSLDSDSAERGVITGTPAYMSPEQAQGAPVDHRADIWAVGCILYEMLTGVRPFPGKTVLEVISAVMTQEPDWAKLPAEAPVRVIRLCLVKDANQRLHHVADARVLLDDVAPPPQARRTYWIPLLAAALASMALAYYVGARRLPTISPVTRATIELAAGAQLALGTIAPLAGFSSPALTISRDGRYLVYVGQTSTGGTQLYLRETASLAIRPLHGTEGATYSFFSPDGKWLGFLTNDKVKKVAIEGGAPVVLSDARQPARASWTTGDQIFIFDAYGMRVSKIPASGGQSVIVASVPMGVFSDVLPGAEWALLTDWRRGISADHASLMLWSLKTGESKLLLRSGYDARYVASGHLVFARGADLYGVRFDPQRGEVTGEPLRIAGGVSMDSFWGQAHISVSDSGLLAYIPGDDLSIGRLTWVDGGGKREVEPAPARLYGSFSLSPDSTRVAVHVADTTDYIWLYDLNKKEGRRLAAGRHYGWPIWNADSSRLAFSAWDEQGRTIVVQEPGGGFTEVLKPVELAQRRIPSSWSPDGKVMAVDRWGGVGFLSIDERTFAIPDPNLNYWGSVFSPDGKWVAYVSEDMGRAEIHVRSFPDGKVTRQVSTDGGVEPVWCPCGKLYWRNGWKWYSTAIRTQPDLSWDSPKLSFETDFIDSKGRSFAVSHDGKRLLVARREKTTDTSRIQLVMNWSEGIR